MNGTRAQQAAAKVRHLAKKPHARGHCELCQGPLPAPPTFATHQPIQVTVVAR